MPHRNKQKPSMNPKTRKQLIKILEEGKNVIIRLYKYAED